jgi:hypothetical protein
MATVKEIRAALKTNLENIPGTQKSAYLLGSPSPPTLQIFPGEVDWHMAMNDGLAKREFIVQALVGQPTEEGTQVVLDEFLDETGDSSVKSAIESDSTLGGLVDDVIVVKTKGYQLIKNPSQPDKPPRLGAEWHVDVYVSPE